MLSKFDQAFMHVSTSQQQTQKKCSEQQIIYLTVGTFSQEGDYQNKMETGGKPNTHRRRNCMMYMRRIIFLFYKPYLLYAR